MLKAGKNISAFNLGGLAARCLKKEEGRKNKARRRGKKRKRTKEQKIYIPTPDQPPHGGVTGR